MALKGFSVSPLNELAALLRRRRTHSDIAQRLGRTSEPEFAQLIVELLPSFLREEDAGALEDYSALRAG